MLDSQIGSLDWARANHLTGESQELSQDMCFEEETQGLSQETLVGADVGAETQELPEDERDTISSAGE